MWNELDLSKGHVTGLVVALKTQCFPECFARLPPLPRPLFDVWALPKEYDSSVVRECHGRERFGAHNWSFEGLEVSYCERAVLSPVNAMEKMALRPTTRRSRVHHNREDANLDNARLFFSVFS